MLILNNSYGGTSMYEEKSLALELLELQNMHTRRLTVAITAIAIAAMICITSVVGIFVWYINQYDFETTTITQTAETSVEDDGSATAIINDEGEVTINGTSKSNQN